MGFYIQPEQVQEHKQKNADTRARSDLLPLTMDEPNEISSLRQALSFSPDNVVLRKLLADTLVKYGRYAQAEEEYRRTLEQDPANPVLESCLAEVFFQQEKRDEAFVILENLEKRGQLTRESALLYARLLSQTTELVKAAQIYRSLKEQFPECEDAELEEELAPFLIEDSDDYKIPAGDMPPESPAMEKERPGITFADVGGMERVKEDIRMKIIHPLQHADLFKAYGKKIGGGLLLFGPPGCGKTYLARATAGEVKASFFSIGLHDVLDMWIGQSEKNLHEIFEQARRSAPAVLFIDEIDALGASRTDMKNSGSRYTINQFLSELDGVQHSNEGLLVLGATNAPWHLDNALRRPGRFDQIIFVPPPDLEARAAILRIQLRDKPARDIDFDAVAKKMEGFSGADIKAVVDQAIEGKLEEAMKKGGLVPVVTKDLLKAAGKVKPSTREWFASAKNHAIYANQSGHYDEILEYLKIKKP